LHSFRWSGRERTEGIWHTLSSGLDDYPRCRLRAQRRAAFLPILPPHPALLRFVKREELLKQVELLLALQNHTPPHRSPYASHIVPTSARPRVALLGVPLENQHAGSPRCPAAAPTPPPFPLPPVQSGHVSSLPSVLIGHVSSIPQRQRHLGRGGSPRGPLLLDCDHAPRAAPRPPLLPLAFETLRDQNTRHGGLCVCVCVCVCVRERERERSPPTRRDPG